MRAAEPEVAPRRVLFLAHAFPPSAVVGALRPAKFVQFLPEHDWVPVVITSDQRAYPLGDAALTEDLGQASVVVTRSCETTLVLEWLQRTRSQGRTSLTRFTARVAAYVLDGAVAPDHALGWVPWAALAARKAVRQTGASVIVATGGPFSTLLAGSVASCLTGLPLVVDYRDPWTSTNTYAARPFRRFVSKRMEKAVVKRADAIVVVSEKMRAGLAEWFGESVVAKTQVIPNGYDLGEMPERSRVGLDGKLRIAHVGLFNARRTPEGLWRFLEALPASIAETIDVRLVGAGEDLAVPDSLKSLVSLTPRLPRQEAMQEMVDADLLLILTGNAEDTNTKVFEYLATRRPILVVGNLDASVARTVEEIGAGLAVEPENPGAAIEMIGSLLGSSPEGISFEYEPPPEWSRGALAGRLAGVLDSAAGYRS